MLLPLTELRPADLAAWRALAAGAVEPNPFAEQEFVLPAYAALGEDAALLTVVHGHRWVAVLPVRRVDRWRRLPVTALTTWTHPYCFLGTPLLDGTDAETAARQLVQAGREHGKVFVLERFGDGGPAAAALRSAAPKGIEWERYERAALYRREEPTYLTETVRGVHRKGLRRLHRLLDKDLGGHLHTVDRAGDPLAVDAFLALEAAGWKGRAGTAMRTAGHAELFRAVCATFADAGRLRLLSLERARTAVAMSCMLTSADVGFTFKVTYDEQYASRSPGTLLDLDQVEHFHADRRLAALDSCAEPGNEQIERLWPDRRGIATLVVPGRGMGGLAGRWAAASAGAVRRTVRGGP